MLPALLTFPRASIAGDPGLRLRPPDHELRLPGNGVLMMRNGRLVQGYVSENAGGFVVDLKNGRMMVPRSQVRYTAASADGIYRKLRTTVPPASPKARLTLAGWCATNRLYDQARREVQDVLKANPEHALARRMLKRIDAIIASSFRKPAPRYKTLGERLTAPEVTSLAGLAPDLAREYVGRIQPILMNGCANSGCHGPRAENGFRLTITHLRGGARRGISERNLAAVLRYVDVNYPERSPLLLVPRGNHGRRGRAVFSGAGGAKQLARLRAWVAQVARQTKPARSDAPHRTGRAASRGRPDQRRVAATALEVRRTPTGRRSGGYSPRNAAPAYQQTPAMQFLRAARSNGNRLRPAGLQYGGPGRPADENSLDVRDDGRRQRPRVAARGLAGDPFDPDAFNRKFATSDQNRSTSPPNRGRNP